MLLLGQLMHGMLVPGLLLLLGHHLHKRSEGCRKVRVCPEAQIGW
jgi:hypothetical protein